jgi:hypothetical protein
VLRNNVVVKFYAQSSYEIVCLVSHIPEQPMTLRLNSAECPSDILGYLTNTRNEGSPSKRLRLIHCRNRGCEVTIRYRRGLYESGPSELRKLQLN